MSTTLPLSTPHCELPLVRSPAAGDGRDDYGDRPYCQATLAEHERLHIRLRRVGYAFEDEVLRFLGVEDRDTLIASTQYPFYDVPQAHRALRRCFPDWSAVREGGADGYSGHLWAPGYRRFLVRPGRRRSYLVHGTQFFQLPDGRRRVVLWETRDCAVEFALIGPRSEKREIEREQRLLRRRFNRGHYLRGQAVDAAGGILSGKRQVGWSDLILDAERTALLQRHVVDFLRLRQTYRRNGVPHRRGILLYGPPGNGKTTVGRVLAGLGRTTFVYVTAADVGCNAFALRSIFELARRLRPAVLFLEDLDFYASERGHGANETALGELLAQMDGLEQNDGLIVIATTNDLAAIEPALRDRPSRFDLALEIPMPAAAERRRLLTHFLRDARLSEEDVAAAGDGADGLSGAQLRELAVLVVQQAILRNALDDEGRALPTRADVDAALAQMLGRKKSSPLGFHTQP